MVVVNLLAVLVATIAAFALGWIWYSPQVFGRIWMRESDTTNQKTGHHTAVYIVTFILVFISAFGFAVFLNIMGSTNVMSAVHLGFAVSVMFIATSFAVNYLFANRSIKLLWIDTSYYIVKFILFGVILGLWR